MCGIFGVALRADSDRRLEEERIISARDTLRHRGPDEAGIYIGDRAALGHRRLSIVDVESGHQPMGSDDGRFHLVYNGEIYNHLELRPGLERLGHAYRTRCDTETVLRLYQEHGRDSVTSLRGMFAFAIWDAREATLFLARDRLGIKPLYWARADDGSLFFASEIKALLEAGAVKPELNYTALPDYLANHAPSGSETLFQGVHRLPPGHTMVWRDGELDIRPYWRLEFPPAGESRVEGDPVAAFRDLLTESIDLRLMADVPLGVFLSGGIDSAAITAIMARLVDEPIKSFSVAFAEREANELGYARTVAEAFSTDHHEIVVSGRQFFDSLPGLIWHEDEPIAHPSSIPLHFVAKLAQEHVKVVLTGEGSDELLGGYLRYWKTLENMRLGRWTPPALRAVLRAGIRTLPASSRARQKAERTFLCIPPDVTSIYLDNFAVFSRARQLELLAPETIARVSGAGPYDQLERMLDETADLSLLNRLLYVDTRTYLHELLMKQDQMSMAASIESRVPFLDQELVELATGLPDSWKVRRTTTKRVLRAAMEGILPDSILARPKMGFPVPFGRWIRGPYRGLVEDTVRSDRARARDLFDPAMVRGIVEEHMSGTIDHSERIWALVNLELWQRAFLDGEGRAVEAPPAAATG